MPIHTNKFPLECFLGTSCVKIMAKSACFATRTRSIRVLVFAMAHTLLDPLMIVFNWSMQLMFLFGVLFPTKRHDDGTPLDKFMAKAVKLPLHFTAVLLQARGDWQFYDVWFGFPAWNSVQMCWLRGASQDGGIDFTTVHNLHHGGN